MKSYVQRPVVVSTLAKTVRPAKVIETVLSVFTRPVNVTPGALALSAKETTLSPFTAVNVIGGVLVATLNVKTDDSPLTLPTALVVVAVKFCSPSAKDTGGVNDQRPF